MNNQGQGLFDTLKKGAEAAGTYALGLLGLACEGAEKLTDTAKLRYRAARVEGELDGKLMEVGELAYEAYSGDTQVSDEMEEKMRAIDSLKVELEALNEELGRMPEEEEVEEILVCPTCGSEVDEEDHFCRVCGVKLD